MLHDIIIKHEYKSRRSSIPQGFWMCPFRNTEGQSAGRFEIIYTRKLAGSPIKRSAHVTLEQLAELFARELLQEYGMRLRVRPIDAHYPASPPGKKVPSSCIERGSPFDRMVRAIDTKRPLSPGLQKELASVGIRI